MPAPWWAPEDAEQIPSPALLIYPDRVERNVRKMVEMAGDPARLRPHVKTHKLEPIIQLQLRHGITRFKCATIAEAEMTAHAGAADVLLAYPTLGPNVPRLANLAAAFPRTRFSALVDSQEGLTQLDQGYANTERPLPVFVDLDCGMHRTGIAPGPAAAALYEKLSASRALRPAGLHAYDGHLHQSDPAERLQACREAFAPIEAFRQELIRSGYSVPDLIAGGTPTFPIHARNPGWQCAPGTTVLWDFGYSDKFKDLPFEWAGVLMTRVVSRPSSERFCLDLGHKAVASENPPPRVRFLDDLSVEPVGHSEEHLVIESAADLKVGQALYAIPRHICPTVALHSEVWFVEKGKPSRAVEVTARSRRLHF
jgi:D-threonine aldolase